MLREWHNNFHFFTGSLLRSELENVGAPAVTLDAEVMVRTFAVEGLLMQCALAPSGPVRARPKASPATGMAASKSPKINPTRTP